MIIRTSHVDLDIVLWLLVTTLDFHALGVGGLIVDVIVVGLLVSLNEQAVALVGIEHSRHASIHQPLDRLDE